MQKGANVPLESVSMSKVEEDAPMALVCLERHGGLEFVEMLGIDKFIKEE